MSGVATADAMKTSNAEYANKLAEYKLPVFPCHNRPDDEKRHKKPLVSWRTASTSDPVQVREWWERFPDALPAIDLGKCGLVVLDGDRHQENVDGVAALDALFMSYGGEIVAPSVLTPGNGRHVYLKQPRGKIPLGNGRGGLPPGIDVRGSGGYVIAPGASLPDGRRYSWDQTSPNFWKAVREGTIPELPAGIDKILREESKFTSTEHVDGGVWTEAPKLKHKPAGHREAAWATAAMTGCAAELAGMPADSGRNNTCNAMAFRMGRMTARGWIARQAVFDALFNAAHACGLVKDDGPVAVRKTLKSGFDAGEKEPHPDLPNDDPRPTSGSINGQEWELTAGPEDQQDDAVETIIPLPFISARSWDGLPIPERQWLVRDRIPKFNVTLLSGDGASGKTTIALQLCAGTVCGTDWLNALIEDPGPAMFYTGEEDADELHRRIDAIRSHFHLSYADIAGLHRHCLAGEDAILAATDRSGIVRPTLLMKRLEQAARDLKPKVVVIESLADVFAGDENVRPEAKQCIGLFRGLAIRAECSVVLLAHPSLSGMASKSGTAGSTQWNNAVRSRMYFTRPDMKDDDLAGGDIRELEVKKANYGPRGEVVRLRWNNWVFVPDSGGLSFERMAAEGKVDDLFLFLLDKLNAQGQVVSPSFGRNYAPVLFLQQPAINGCTKEAFARAMQRLLDAGRIRIENEGPSSRARQRLVRA
jgi:RecA-family ATPase